MFSLADDYLENPFSIPAQIPVSNIRKVSRKEFVKSHKHSHHSKQLSIEGECKSLKSEAVRGIALGSSKDEASCKGKVEKQRDIAKEKVDVTLGEREEKSDKALDSRVLTTQ